MHLALALATCLATTSSSHNHGPVVVVGVDGMTFDIVDPMVAQGRMPTMARLLKQGARAILRSERPMRSPALWTTIATGQPRKVHRVYDFVTGSAYWPAAERSTEQRLVTSDMRAAPALWQLAGNAGRRSLVVGWLNTWPAERLNGIMVAPYVALGERRQTSIKGKIYERAPKQAYPTDVVAFVEPLIMAPEEVPQKLVDGIVDSPPTGSNLYRELPKLKRYLYTVRWSIAGAVTNVAIIEDLLLRQPDTELVMTYFDGADTLAHRFWIMRESEARIRERLAAHNLNPKLATELKARLGNAVEGYYELFDNLLARMLKAAGPEATVIVISDHGWGTSPGPRATHGSVPFDGEHRMEGIFVAAGPHIKAGFYAPLTQYDIAPTTLYLLNTGVPQAMPGRVAPEIINDEFARQHPPMVLAEKKPQTPTPESTRSAAPFEDTELERLRSLGYVN